MGVIGSYINNLQLRRMPLSDLEWRYEPMSEAYVARSAESGLMMAYITRECAYETIFTTESLVSSWIWRVSALCIGGPEGSEPPLELLNQK